MHLRRADQYTNALDVIGIATESGSHTGRRSEDALYFDAREWNDSDEDLARKYQTELGILNAERALAKRIVEYPVAGATRGHLTPVKSPRNRPCPCGSGRKYKFCHGG